MSGIFYVVATPIGNLNDITYRALETLKSVDLIASEDTRHTQGLLSHFSIEKKQFAVHQHNEKASAQKIIEYLKDGKHIALVSDAVPRISAILVALSSKRWQLLVLKSFLFQAFLQSQRLIQFQGWNIQAFIFMDFYRRRVAKELRRLKTFKRKHAL